MAALLQHTDSFENATTSQSKEKSNEIFMPKETIDQPWDMILVVEDCKELKAHRQVLSQASPFFEKLLNSDMKESKEGVIRLEMFSETAMGTTLEFIYTGHVQILDEDSARDLIAIADYLFLQKLKTLAEGFLLDKLNTSNCISTYHVSQRYQCEELLTKTEKFILANFTAVFEVNREGFLNLSSKEIEMWISSDEIDVSAEEDVFKIILAWIDHDRDKRKKYFGELFRQVRLVCVSRDFLCSDVVTNELVRENEDSLELVKEAVRLIDSRNFDNLSVTARKSLKCPVIIAVLRRPPPRTGEIQRISCGVSVWKSYDNRTDLHDQDILCYFTRENKWCKLDKMPCDCTSSLEFVYWRGKLYENRQGSYQKWCEKWNFPREVLSPPFSLENVYSNCWMKLPYKKDRELRKVFVSNEDEIYALVSEGFYMTGFSHFEVEKRVSYIVKYKPESNLWDVISSFDHFERGLGACIIAKDNYIYFIGGIGGVPRRRQYLTDVDRYDLNRNHWDKVADFQQQKFGLSGALANGKIFIAGRIVENEEISETYQCEVYSDVTNECQFTRSFHIKEEARPKLLCVDDELYVVSTLMWNWRRGKSPETRVECYDPDKNEWNKTTDVPLLTSTISHSVVKMCSGRIFKGFLSDHELESITNNSRKPPEQDRHKCIIM